MKISNPFMYQIASRIFIVGVYVAILFTFLYSPLIFDFFRPQKSITVCVFVETFSQEAIKQFEQETGIKVYLTYAEIDEQIYAKFQINQGAEYDVVNLSDYMIDRLSKQGLLHEIDHSKIPNISSLDSRLMKQSFDPKNTYSLPHKWYTYGLVYDKKFFTCKPEDMSLSFIFKNPKILHEQGIVPAEYRLCMLDDARDSITIAGLYLFGHANDYDDQELPQIKSLLIEQKHWVEAYTVHSSQYFLYANIIPIALISSNYVRKIFNNSDRFDFAVPKEGSPLIIENLAIPQSSKHIEWAQQFINFMLSDKITALNSDTYEYNSSNKNAHKNVKPQYLSNPHLFPNDKLLKKLFIPIYPLDKVRKNEEIWLSVGFA